MAGRAAEMYVYMTTADGDDLAGLIPERVGSSTPAPARQFEVDPFGPFRKTQPVKYHTGIGHGCAKTETRPYTYLPTYGSEACRRSSRIKEIRRSMSSDDMFLTRDSI